MVMLVIFNTSYQAFFVETKLLFQVINHFRVNVSYIPALVKTRSFWVL